MVRKCGTGVATDTVAYMTNTTLEQPNELIEVSNITVSNFGLTTVQLCLNTPATRLARGLAVQSSGVQQFYQPDTPDASSADASPPKPQHKDN